MLIIFWTQLMVNIIKTFPDIEQQENLHNNLKVDLPNVACVDRQ